MKTKIAQTVDDLIPIAKAILADAKNNRIFALEAKMGAGKTTLLLTLLQVLYSKGHRILMRDDGGLEFLHLLHKIPI